MFIIRFLATDSNTLPFAVMLWGISVIVAICLAFFTIEIITDAIKRSRYKKFRKGYVDLSNYED